MGQALRNPFGRVGETLANFGQGTFTGGFSGDTVLSGETKTGKTEIKTGLRDDKSIEIISGLNIGDIIVAEGLKKVRPRGKIKPINK